MRVFEQRGEVLLDVLVMPGPVAVLEPEAVARGVKAHDELQAALADGPLQLAGDVAPGTHVLGVPGRPLAVPHGEPVVMLAHGTGKPRPGLHKQLSPPVGVEFFRFEQGHEVRITEPGLITVGLDVMLVFRAALDIHVARVPLAAEGRHAVNAPVEIDADLVVAEPVGGGVVFLERFPCRFVRILGTGRPATPGDDRQSDQGPNKRISHGIGSLYGFLPEGLLGTAPPPGSPCERGVRRIEAYPVVRRKAIGRIAKEYPFLYRS